MSWAKQVRVRVSSWSDPEFVRADWYPPGLPAGRRLDFYAQPRPHKVVSPRFWRGGQQVLLDL